MRNRYLVFGLAAFIAIAMAVPALGGPSNPIASSSANALKIAKKAKQKATAAQTTADEALAKANAADTKAANAQTTASAAQTAATNAQNTANSKYGSVSNVEGTPSPSDNTDKSVVIAACPGGNDLVGGGFIINGTGNADAAVTLNSAYLTGWAVIADDQGTLGTNWDVTASARCVT